MDNGPFIFIVTCKDGHQLRIQATKVLDCTDGYRYFICEPFNKDIKPDDVPVSFACRVIPAEQVNKMAYDETLIVRAVGDVYTPFKIAPNKQNAYPMSCVRDTLIAESMRQSNMNVTDALALLKNHGFTNGTFKCHDGGLFMSWSTGFNGRGDSVDINCPTNGKVTVELHWQDNRLNGLDQPPEVAVEDFNAAVAYVNKTLNQRACESNKACEGLEI